MANIIAKTLNIAEIINVITKDNFVVEGKDGRVIVKKKVLAEQISVSK